MSPLHEKNEVPRVCGATRYKEKVAPYFLNLNYVNLRSMMACIFLYGKPDSNVPEKGS